jgi:hypothetical protein
MGATTEVGNRYAWTNPEPLERTRDSLSKIRLYNSQIPALERLDIAQASHPNVICYPVRLTAGDDLDPRFSSWSLQQQITGASVNGRPAIPAEKDLVAHLHCLSRL